MEIPTKHNEIGEEHCQDSSKENIGENEENDEYDTTVDTEWEMEYEASLESDYSSCESELVIEPQPSKEHLNDIPMHKYPFKLKQNEEG